MFKAKLKAAYQDLTQSEKLVADYILEHIDDIKTITSHQLAINTNIGQSTIIRFSQKLGYGSFRELLADLSAIPRQDIYREEIQIHESMNDTNRKIIAQYQDIVEITFQNNKAEIIQQACDMLTRAKKVITFGIGSSSLFCEYRSVAQGYRTLSDLGIRGNSRGHQGGFHRQGKRRSDHRNDPHVQKSAARVRRSAAENGRV